jgi:hypothetical protein
MVHYAELDENNIVIRVFPSGVDEDTVDGEEFYNNMFKETGHTFKKADYFTGSGMHSEGGIPFRKNYPGIGYTYDSVRDAFIPPKPYPSWTWLNEDTCCWAPPVPFPDDGQDYTWYEDEQKWLTWEEFTQRMSISENT